MRDVTTGAIIGACFLIFGAAAAHEEYVRGYADGRHDARAHAARVCEQEKATAAAQCRNAHDLDEKECRARVEDRILNCEHRITDVIAMQAHDLDVCWSTCR